jgi:glucokinase
VPRSPRTIAKVSDSLLLRTPRGDVPAIGHGGLVRFAPECIEELQMLGELAGDIDFIPAEALISKPGIVAVYQLLRKRNGRAVEPISAVEIATAAQSEDPDAKVPSPIFLDGLEGLRVTSL